jgi:hypothetical protein
VTALDWESKANKSLPKFVKEVQPLKEAIEKCLIF